MEMTGNVSKGRIANAKLPSFHGGTAIKSQRALSAQVKAVKNGTLP